MSKVIDQADQSLLKYLWLEDVLEAERSGQQLPELFKLHQCLQNEAIAVCTDDLLMLISKLHGLLL